MRNHDSCKHRRDAGCIEEFFSDEAWEPRLRAILQEHGISYEGSRFDVIVPYLVPYEDGHPDFRAAALESMPMEGPQFVE